MDTVPLLILLCCAAHTYCQVRSLGQGGGQQHTVELMVVVDKAAIDLWYEKTPGGEDRYNKTVERVADFLASVVVGVNNLYTSASRYGLALDVRLKKIHVLKHDVWTEKDTRAGHSDQIPSDRAIKLFYAWSWKNRKILGTFDHAMLLTGYDIIDPKDPDKPTQGVAYKGVICKYGRVSVIENSFTYQIVDTTAHELGHSLGCDHDGDENRCDNNLGHVMSSRTEINSTHRWSFSPCSVEAMKANIAQLNRMNANCLLSTTTDATPGVEMGMLMGADQQCRMVLGPDAYFCRDFYSTPPAYAKLCSSMWCSASHKESLCRNYIASDGFVCGHGKICKQGGCVLSDTAVDSAASDNCPQGDQPGIVHENLTCSDVINTRPWLCYGSFFRRKCCHSCPSIKENVPGCEYGNKEGWCSTEMQYPFDCYLNDNTCCKSCQQYRQNDKPDCQYGDHNVQCQTKLSVPIGCYENEALCCETCVKEKSVTNPECPYGDRSTWCRDQLEVPNGCYLNQHLCCGTCSMQANVTMTRRLQEHQSANTSSAVVDKPINSTDEGVSGCMYGDRYPDWCQKQTPFVCYNTTRRQWCCESCAKFEKPEETGCEYGDQHANCGELVYPYACYNSDNARVCCWTCGLYRNTSRPDCPYGDHEAWCYKLNEKYTNDQWCHLDADNGHCCGTCLYDETAIPVFGSRVKKLGLPKPK